MEKGFLRDYLLSRCLLHSCALLSSLALPSQGPKRWAQPGRKERSLGGTGLDLVA